jgi:hypothetical protein
MFFASLALSLPLCVWRGGVIHRRGARISAASTQVGPRATLPDVGGFCWGFFCVGGGGGGANFGCRFVGGCGHVGMGLSPISWGARWTPYRSQLPSNVINRANATRLGRPLGSYHPPGPPRGWAVRPCRASTSLAPLYSPCASSVFGWGSKPPSRSALAPVGSSPGLVLSQVTALQFSRFAQFQLGRAARQIEIETTY